MHASKRMATGRQSNGVILVVACIGEFDELGVQVLLWLRHTCRTSYSGINSSSSHGDRSTSAMAGCHDDTQSNEIGHGDLGIEEVAEVDQSIVEGSAHVLTPSGFEADGGIQSTRLGIDVGGHKVVKGDANPFCCCLTTEGVVHEASRGVDVLAARGDEGL